MATQAPLGTVDLEPGPLAGAEGTRSTQMYSLAQETPAAAGARAAPASPEAARERGRRRALIVTSALTLGSLALLVDLLLAGHTTGEEIWGPLTATGGFVVGLLSLAFLATRGRSRVALVGLYVLWSIVAFFGFGGYNDHRLPRPVDTITDQRERPPLAPLVFTGFGIAGAVALRSGSKGQ